MRTYFGIDVYACEETLEKLDLLVQYVDCDEWWPCCLEYALEDLGL